MNNTQEEALSDNDQEEDESTPILSHAVNDLRRYTGRPVAQRPEQPASSSSSELQQQQLAILEAADDAEGSSYGPGIDDSINFRLTEPEICCSPPDISF
ncbi:hypothetical protein evm_000680 [Chilo suppressalis]|nr:hypothetical protein evm_000680 [Chilo suppressalis]